MADTFPVHAIRAQSHPDTNRPVASVEKTCRTALPAMAVTKLLASPVEIMSRPSVSLWSGGLEAVPLHVLVGNAPYRPAGSGEEEFLDGYAKKIDSEKIGDVVVALNETWIEEKKTKNNAKYKRAKLSAPMSMVGIKSERRTAITAAQSQKR